MPLLLEAVVESTSYTFSLTTVGVVGFAAATVIGSIAWYNSKRPAGWEGKDRPGIVPEIEK